MKSGDKIIIGYDKSLPMWLEGFAGYVINIYQKRASVRVPVADNRIFLIKISKCIKLKGELRIGMYQ